VLSDFIDDPLAYLPFLDELHGIPIPWPLEGISRSHWCVPLAVGFIAEGVAEI
jgi:hypothetical protein